MTITSCNPYQIKLRESSRTYSPDSTKYLLRYDKVSWDGYPFPYVTILNSSDNVSSSDLKSSYSKWDIDTIYWKNNDTAIIEEPYTDFITRGVPGLKDTVLNKVASKVIQRDPIDTTYKRKMVYHSISPNGQYELEAYKYLQVGQRNFYLNVSIVARGDKFPKYGNFYISPYDFICFTNIQWDSASNLVVIANDRRTNDFNDYIVKGKSDIKYRVEFSDTAIGNIEPQIR